MIDCETLKNEYNIGYSILQLSYKYREPFVLIYNKLKSVNCKLRTLKNFKPLNNTVYRIKCDIGNRDRKIFVKKHICAVCGACGTTHIHHLWYPIKEFNPKSVIELCPACHGKEHVGSISKPIVD